MLQFFLSHFLFFAEISKSKVYFIFPACLFLHKNQSAESYIFDVSVRIFTKKVVFYPSVC